MFSIIITLKRSIFYFSIINLPFDFLLPYKDKGNDLNKKKIEDNFSVPEFEEAFAINLGGAFKSRKDKLAWINMIDEPKGKKKVAITKSDLSKLWIIRDHLAQFNI